NYTSTDLVAESFDGNHKTDIVNAGLFDSYIAKYNRSGVLQWFLSIGGTNDDFYRDFDIKGDVIYTTGYFSNTIIINNDTLTTTSGSNQDVFLAALNNIGNPISGISIKGTGNYTDVGSTIFTDFDLTAYVSGTYKSASIQIGDSVHSGNVANTENFFVATYAHPFAAAFTEKINPVCNGDNNGRLTVTPYFGIPPYSYQWSHNAGLNNATASNLAAGNYHVTVTDSRDSVTVQTGALTQPLSIGLAFSNTNALCYNENSGSIDLSVSGALPLTPMPGPGEPALIQMLRIRLACTLAPLP
ncbi:MAG: hypothetical protein HC896_12225, partial [Bacteroidales bacterium]|nr:hypothetical protein [Bacteroidales bacterium]